MSLQDKQGRGWLYFQGGVLGSECVVYGHKSSRILPVSPQQKGGPKERGKDMGGGGRGSHITLGVFFTALKPFVILQEAPKETSCSRVASDRLCIVSNVMPNWKDTP